MKQMISCLFLDYNPKISHYIRANIPKSEKSQNLSTLVLSISHKQYLTYLPPQKGKDGLSG